MTSNQKGISILEILGSLAIILLISLASGAITKQVLQTSKKSKAVMLAISLESSFLEALDNADQEGYNEGFAGENVRESLRLGKPPAQIQLWSPFGTDKDTADSTADSKITRQLLYKMSLAPANPEYLYLNDSGNFVTTEDSWAIRLQAQYKRMPDSASGIAQYAVAYEISGNPEVGLQFRPLGLKSAEVFTDTDFVFPISQLLYIGQHDSYTDLPGKCDGNQRRVISLYSINLETGKTYCVLKGNECPPDHISVGIKKRAPSGEGHFYVDLECLPVRKCGCKHIGAFNWVVHKYIPKDLIKSTGSRCGECKFAAPKMVDAQVPENTAGAKVCPSENYQATDIVCRKEITNTQKISSEPHCKDVEPPSGSDTFAGSAASDNYTAVCEAGPENTSCWSWEYQVSILSAKCELTGDQGETKPALIE